MSGKAKILLAVSAIFTLAMGLSNVFVNIFIWKQSENFITIALYNLMHYLMIPPVFISAGWLAKRKNGIWPLRIGIAIFALFFGLVLLLRDRVAGFVVPFGILFGIAAGFYWLAYHVLSFDFTDTSNRDTFNGYNGSISGAAGAIAPFAAAYIIERNKGMGGYSIVFFITLVLFIVLALVTLPLRSEHYARSLDLRKALGRNNSEWGNLRRSIMAWGLRDVVIGFLIVILIFKTTGSELSVGKLSFAAATISSVAFILEQKFIKPKLRLLSMHIGALLMFISVLGLAYRIGYGTLLLFIFMDAMFMPFFMVPLSSASFNIINRSHDEDFRAEYVINKEIMLNTGRIVSTAVLIALLSFIKHENILNYFLFVLGGVQFIALFYLRKLKIWKSGG